MIHLNKLRNRRTNCSEHFYFFFFAWFISTYQMNGNSILCDKIYHKTNKYQVSSCQYYLFQHNSKSFINVFGDDSNIVKIIHSQQTFSYK